MPNAFSLLPLLRTNTTKKDDLWVRANARRRRTVEQRELNSRGPDENKNQPCNDDHGHQKPQQPRRRPHPLSRSPHLSDHFLLACFDTRPIECGRRGSNRRSSDSEARLLFGLDKALAERAGPWRVDLREGGSPALFPVTKYKQSVRSVVEPSFKFLRRCRRKRCVWTTAGTSGSRCW